MRTRMIFGTITACLIAFSANAQSCLENLDPKTGTFEQLVNCVKNELAQEVAAELVANHSDELRGPQGLKGEVGEANIPSGAVMAFDLPDGCPVGWKIFEEATSRVIIGAFADRAAGAVAAPTEDENGKALLARHYRSTGGVEEISLTESQMPRHEHELTQKSGNYLRVRQYKYQPGQNSIHWLDVSGEILLDHIAFASGGDEDGPIGNSKPHNNMPPYIALNFCKKE